MLKNTLGSFLSRSYNKHPRGPDRIMEEMKIQAKYYYHLVWEDTQLDIFLFHDNSMVIIPEGDGAISIDLNLHSKDKTGSLNYFKP